MLPKLGPSQFKTLSEFCNDVAKGLLLAAVIGQGALEGLSGTYRATMSLFWTLASLSMLYFALSFSQEAKS